MFLEDGCGEIFGDRSVNCPADGCCFRRAVDDDQEMAGFLDGSQALGYRVRGHVFKRCEEPRVRFPAVLRERDNAGARVESRTRFIEGQMAIASDPQDLEVYASRGSDQVLVFVAGRCAGIFPTRGT